MFKISLQYLLMSTILPEISCVSVVILRSPTSGLQGTQAGGPQHMSRAQLHL